MLNEYRAAVENYITALKEYGEAQLALELAKHTNRVALYAKKAAGEKLTEEQIRSNVAVMVADKTQDLMNKQTELEIARVKLDLEKDIYNKGE